LKTWRFDIQTELRHGRRLKRSTPEYFSALDEMVTTLMELRPLAEWLMLYHISPQKKEAVKWLRIEIKNTLNFATILS